MRFLVGAILGMVAVASAATTAGDGSPPGLRVDAGGRYVRSGSLLRARVLWEAGDDFYVGGEFTARWQLRDPDGIVVAHGRRPVRIGFNDTPPFRFTVSARVPRGLDRTLLRLEVGIVDEPSVDLQPLVFARGEISVVVVPGRKPRFARREDETWSGTLEERFGAIALAYPGEPYYRLFLAGPGESALLANPAWRGARVTVTGPRFATSFIPEDPGLLLIEAIEWLDPLPESVPAGSSARGGLPARLPPPEVIGEVNWARFMRDSREPRVLETAEELEALHVELGTGETGTYDPIPYLQATTDFATHRVVVVFTGVNPDPAWAVTFDGAVYDARSGSTFVDYSVVAPSDGTARGFRWSEAWTAVALERRDGPVEFRRHEWIPEPPPWW